MSINIENLLGRLGEFDALRSGDGIRTGAVERIVPQNERAWPSHLNPSVRAALDRIGMGKPYKHQFEAVGKSLDGADVVLESPTASGKTLAFTVPMLHALETNPGSHAMMVYPMKALAFDQRTQIQQLCAPLGVESWTYDGDTDNEYKSALRSSPPHILLTNPEYLNRSFLGWREQWDGFLKNLKFLVIDEMHEYRGFFGSNMALLLRRFFLYLDRIGASPQVFLSTATCANPAEHAKNLTGRDVEVVSARDALRPKRHFVFARPDIRDYGYQDILRRRVESASLALLSEGLQTLVFCPTKRFLESAFIGCIERAKKLGFDSKGVSAFHADMNSEDKQTIQQKIKSGEIKVVFTTNALELGLDIGGLDAVILAGFPPSVMSAWQQIGRAGRGWDKDALVLFYAMNDPIDRFFVGNLDAFLNKPFDELVVDPANKELIGKHIPSLVSETSGKFRPSDADILGGPFYDEADQNRGTLPQIPGYTYRPQMQVNMRGGIGQSFALKRGNEEIGQVSAMRRFREAYIGAVFPFFGRKYRVHAHEENAVALEDVDQNLRTDPGFFTHLNPGEIHDGVAYGDVQVYLQTINIVMNFTGYKLIEDPSGAVRWISDTTDARYQNNLYALAISAPPGDIASDGIGALEHMIRVGAMFVIPADRFDASTFSKDGESLVYYYENYPGGIGVAKKLFEVWPIALKKGVEIAENCGCRLGCQNCIEPAKSYNISNANIDKRPGIELAHRVLEAAESEPNFKWSNGMMVPV